MYFGHLILMAVILIFMLIAIVFSYKHKRAFPYVCRTIAITFVVLSAIYYYDVFIYTPTSDGVKLNWAVYLLTQNEDFILRDGKLLGLYWGIGIALTSFLLSFIPFKNNAVTTNNE